MLLQVLAIFLTFVTLKVWPLAAPLEALALDPADPLAEPDAVPFSSTWLFTRELSFEVSPLS